MRFFYFFILLFTLSTASSGSESAIASQIIDKSATSIFRNEQILTWGETPDHINIIKQSSHMKWTNDPKSARFVLVSKNIPNNLSDNAVIFATEYKLFIKDERIIGAFFWQKGRPNLLFLHDRLKKSNLTLGKEFDKYIEDEL